MQEMLNASRLGLFFTVLVIGPGCEVTEKEKIVYLEKQVFVEVPVEVEKPMGSDETDKPAENNDDSEAGVNLVDVTLEGNLSFAGAGSLAIGAGLTGFGLTSETYMLYCTTFEDQPRSCGIPVGLDGNYQAKCEKFAGKSFGCFLRKGEETLTTVEFAGDTSLVAGAGTIVSQIIYDAQAKLATAEIDEQASSALSHEAISAAKQATGAKDTLLGDVSGSWKITCVNAPAEGMYCNPADDPNYVNLSVICNPTNTMNSTNAGMTTDPRCMDYYSNPSNFDNMGQPRPPSRNIPGFVYFHQFNHNDLKKVSIWESKGRKDQCLPSGSSFSEINPGIGMRIQNSTSSGTDFHRFNLTSMNTLLNSLDQTVLNLTNSSDPHHVTLAQNLIENAKNRESWQVEQCVNSPFNEGSCKLRVEEIESYTYYDYQQKKDVTQSYTKYWWDLQAFDAWPAVEAGVDLLTVDVVDCTFDAADSSGKPFCPPHASASGTYNEYYKMVDNRRVNLQLVCKNPSGNWLQQWVAPANTVAGAVTLMTESNKKCVRKDVWDPATPAHPYNGLYGAEIDAIRKSLMDLTNSQGFMNQGGQELCRGLDSSPVTINEVTSPWTFATCDDYTNFGWQNPNPGEAICWGRWPLQDQLGLMFDNSIGSQTFGHFISNGVETYDGPGWLDHSFFKLACPVEYGKFQESPIDLVWQGTFESAQKALVNKCRDEFISSDMNNRLGKQIELATKLSTRWDFPLRAIACTSSAIKDKLTTAIENSCMADANYATYCDHRGNCLSSLRCNGSGSGGKCFENGRFIGNVKGRLGVMDLKLRVNGAFELSETKKDRWMQYNWQKNRSETCDLTRSTIINARVGGNLSNVSEFKTVYKTKEDETCEGAGQCSDQAFATKFDCETAGKTWTEIQNAGSTNGTGTAAGAMDQSFQFKKQGLSDVFNRINFEKCANHDCAGELSSSP